MTVGIYAIENLKNKKVYIGQSKNIEKRLLNHKKLLRDESHYNIHLQNSFNLYGEDYFYFHVIEEIDNLMLLNEAESKWIEKYHSFAGVNGYNIAYPTKAYKRFIRKSVWRTCKICNRGYGLFEAMHYERFYYHNLCSPKCRRIYFKQN